MKVFSIIIRLVNLVVAALGIVVATSGMPGLPWGDPSQLAIELGFVWFQAILVPVGIVAFLSFVLTNRPVSVRRVIVNPSAAINITLVATLLLYQWTKNETLIGWFGILSIGASASWMVLAKWSERALPITQTTPDGNA